MIYMYYICFLNIDITGASSSSFNDSSRGNISELDEMSKGVTREEIEGLKHTAMSAISESLLKKLQEINHVSV